MENQEKVIVTVSQLQREFVTLAGRVILALIPIFIYSIIQLIRIGNQADFLLLIIGCILSTVAIMGYIINELTNGVKKKKSFLAMFLAFGGFVPWIFGSYLVFISGFWSLKGLIDGFSIIVIIKSMVFIFLGYIVVSKFHQISEIGKRISNDNFIIKDK